ncbi:MAG: acyl-CoA thioester hydrolase YciA [Planctomycetes bacterium]|nr:acyl-CoA thioester hydrolase YciA [Planctomycetota bacterium]
MTSDASPTPDGDLLLRTSAMPADTNSNGDIFGGWLLSQMDIAGGILAKEVCRGRCVTVAIDGMKFLAPVQVGDVVCCYGRLVKVGSTSMTIDLEVWVRPILRETEQDRARFKVTEARFVYVAIDADRKPRVIEPRA